MLRRFSSRAYNCFILAILTFALSSCGENNTKATSIQPRPVKAVHLVSAKSFNVRSFPGKAKATQEINLAFNTLN